MTAITVCLHAELIIILVVKVIGEDEDQEHDARCPTDSFECRYLKFNDEHLSLELKLCRLLSESTLATFLRTIVHADFVWQRERDTVRDTEI